MKPGTESLEQEADIHKVAGILIQDYAFLVTRSFGKEFFVSPGGKVETGETVQSALQRELNEELGIEVDTADLRPFGTFYANAHGQEGKTIKMDVFIVSAWVGEIVASHEIQEVRWTGSQLPTDMELGSIFQHDVLPRLKDMGLIL